MPVSKVVYGDNTLIDLTSDTVTADKLAEGETAHGADGELITGTMTSGINLDDLVTALATGWTNGGSTSAASNITFDEELVGKYIILFTSANTTNRTISGNCEVIAQTHVNGQGNYYGHLAIVKLTGTSIRVNMSRWRWHVLDV